MSLALRMNRAKLLPEIGICRARLLHGRNCSPKFRTCHEMALLHAVTAAAYFGRTVLFQFVSAALN